MTNSNYRGFELYSRPIERFVDKISITPRGRIGFNKSVDAKHGLRGYDSVLLYCDTAKRRLLLNSYRELLGSLRRSYLLIKEGAAYT